MSRQFAFVTGASSGIGKELAREFAKRGMSLFLVALPDTGLPEVGIELGKTGDINVELLEIDLTAPEAPEKVFTWWKSFKFPNLDVLVNNAGIGSVGEFADMDRSLLLSTIDLNIRALTIITWLFVPNVSHILNVASAGGLFPVPFKAVYSASKSYVVTFSRCLRYELSGKVSVSCLCPTAVYTSPEVRRRVEAAGFFSKLSALEADEVAAYTVPRVLNHQFLIIPGVIAKIGFTILKLLPVAWAQWLLGSAFRKTPERNQSPSAKQERT